MVWWVRVQLVLQAACTISLRVSTQGSGCLDTALHRLHRARAALLLHALLLLTTRLHRQLAQSSSDDQQSTDGGELSAPAACPVKHRPCDSHFTLAEVRNRRLPVR